MKKRIQASILSVAMILLLLLSVFVPTQASAAVLEYSSEYNSGTRDVVCTTLDGTSATSYYQDYDYDDLSTLSSSALFTQLQTLMRSTHTYISSYDDCHYKADRTDCQNKDGSVSLIYTGYSATMSQWNGWNREHVWPKSLGGDTTTGGGADLHHIRPSDAVVNSTRSNNKYGNTNGGSEVYGKTPATDYPGGYYANGYFEPLDNVKGDVARICLYVYVRWNSNWGATDITDVFQSVDVLLEWCEMDPVDTWEMGRNEVVQDIQGNRNVFIDYPEYAWLLFGREVPDDMVTPSGEAMGAGGGSISGGSTPDCDHTNTTTTITIAATCTTTGISTVTCDDCGGTSTSIIPALGHTPDNGTVTVPTCTQAGYTTYICTVCGFSYTGNATAATGHSYVNGTCTGCGESEPEGFVLVTDVSQLKVGDQIIIVAKDYNYALSATQNNNNRGQIAITKDGTSIAPVDGLQIITLEAGTSDNTFAFNVGGGYLYAASSSNNYLRTETTLSANSSWCISISDATATIVAQGTCTRNTLQYNQGSSLFSCYSSASQKAVSIYKLGSNGGGDNICNHTNTTTTITIAATCTTTGISTVTCDDCDAVVSTTSIPATGHQNTTTTTSDATCTVAGQTTVTCDDCDAVVSTTPIPATGHNYVDGTCTGCGETKITGGDVTADPITASKNIADLIVSEGWTSSTTKQTFMLDENVTVKINGGSNTGKAYDGDHIRIYATDTPAGTITISVPDGYELVSVNISTQTGTYAYLYVDGTTTDICNQTASVSGSSVVLNSVKNGSDGKQVRVTGIEVVYRAIVTEPPCEHTNTTTTTIDATCTEAGSITVTCDDCSAVVSESELPALGHNYVSGVCTRCDSTIPVATFVVPTGAKPVDEQNGAEITLPADPGLYNITFGHAYTFVGWALEAQDNVSVAPTLYAPGDVVEIDKNTAFYAVYSYTGVGTTYEQGYIKTDLANIKSTDVVVITMTTSGGKVYALTGANGSSSAPTAVVITVNGNSISGDVDAALLWNISNSSGNLTIYPNGTTAKWLYCTSSNNGVRVGTNANKVFKIDSSSGYLKNTATSRYVGVYTGNPDWRCYTSTSTNIANQTLGFYVLTNKEVVTETVLYTTTLEFSSAFTGASLNVGADLSIRYHAALGENPEDYTVRFTMNDEVTIISGVLEGNKYVFSFCGIAPQCMGDTIKAELLLNGEVVDTVETYSVKQYVIDALELYPDHTELCQLLADLLYYGAAAQEYTGHNSNSLVTDGLELPAASTATPSAADKNKSVTDTDSDIHFTAAGVRFDYDNRIYVKFTAASLDGITVSVGGVDLEIEETSQSGVYIAYSDGISALNFADAVTFTLSSGGNTIQTLVYTVNDYALDKYNDANIGDLALALYRYGISAKAYDDSKA